jgi:hypothetical protein
MAGSSISKASVFEKSSSKKNRLIRTRPVASTIVLMVPSGRRTNWITLARAPTWYMSELDGSAFTASFLSGENYRKLPIHCMLHGVYRLRAFNENRIRDVRKGDQPAQRQQRENICTALGDRKGAGRPR